MMLVIKIQRSARGARMNTYSTPSDQDIREWAGHCTRSMGHYLGIVATKGELGFMTPKLHGWAAFWDSDTAVCEPALLTGW